MSHLGFVRVSAIGLLEPPDLLVPVALSNLTYPFPPAGDYFLMMYGYLRHPGGSAMVWCSACARLSLDKALA